LTKREGDGGGVHTQKPGAGENVVASELKEKTVWKEKDAGMGKRKRGGKRQKNAGVLETLNGIHERHF